MGVTTVAMPVMRRRVELSQGAVVIALRWLLFLVMGCLTLFQGEPRHSVILGGLFLGYGASNTVLSWKGIPGRIRPTLRAFIFVGDVLFVTAVSYLSGDWDTDLFLVFFLVIFMAAVQQSLGGTILVAAVASAVYLSQLEPDPLKLWWQDPRILLRLPFFYVISLFSGYLAMESKRARTDLAEASGRVEKLRASAAHVTRKLAEAQADAHFRESEGQRKDAFVESSSHEIRSALSTVKGNCTLLEQAGNSLSQEERGRLVGAIKRGTTRLEWQMEQVISIMDLERGSFEIYPEKVNFESLLKGCLSWMAGLSRGHEFSYKIEKDLPLVECDALRVELALWNLVTNAVKFAPLGGKIEVSVQAQGQAVAVRVRDEGMGITEGDVPRVFEKFARGSGEAVKGIPGAGLGLYLAKTIAELHGGSLYVESEVGSGSTFTLVLPAMGTGG